MTLPSVCLDRARWAALLAHRFDPSRLEPRESGLALEHALDCPHCSALVVELDPSLLFSRLRTAGRSAKAAGIADIVDQEVESMRVAVAHLRRVSASVGPAAGLGGARGRVHRSRRLASAAALVAAVVGALAFGFGRDVPVASGGAQQASEVLVEPSAAGLGPSFSAAYDDWRLSPVVESLDRSEARVYKIDEARDLSVTMIVDASFDV